MHDNIILLQILNSESFTMKINEKHLVHFAAARNSPVDKEGQLFKRGEVNKAFQTRWFVLKGNLLFYFEKQHDKEPIGVIILEGCTVELAESGDNYTFELVFPGATSRTYVLAAKTQEEMEEWMKAIACAGYDYMKLMVTELQRQLDEINITQSQTNEACSSYVQPNYNINQSAASAMMGMSGVNTHPSPTSNVGQLIDLSIAPTSGDMARMNPFDKRNSSTSSRVSGDVDMFGATPFNPANSMAVSETRARDFREMHADFGREIKKLMVTSE